MISQLQIWILSGVLAVLGLPWWYRLYFKEAIPVIETAISDVEAMYSLGLCLTTKISNSTQYMEDCDKFYLVYLPSKTKDMKHAHELNKFSLKQIKEVHPEIQKVRKMNLLDAYPPLSELSNGKI